MKNISEVKNVINLIKKLNGKKILIQGNHDTKLIKDKEFENLFEEITIYKKINDSGRMVVLMHYPIEAWERSYYGSYHIHGHVHNNEIRSIKNRFNAGVEANNYFLVTLDELISEKITSSNF